MMGKDLNSKHSIKDQQTVEAAATTRGTTLAVDTRTIVAVLKRTVVLRAASTRRPTRNRNRILFSTSLSLKTTLN